jgi:hypothetical protein
MNDSTKHAHLPFSTNVMVDTLIANMDADEYVSFFFVFNTWNAQILVSCSLRAVLRSMLATASPDVITALIAAIQMHYSHFGQK